MFDHNKDDEEKQTGSQFIQESPTVVAGKIKRTPKYIVARSGRDYTQLDTPELQQSATEALELTAAGTVFENVYYPHLLMQRKYFID